METDTDMPSNQSDVIIDGKEINVKKKIKTKKSKISEITEKRNISVKSSSSKFDALQKRSLMNNPQSEKQINCRLCLKPVYKMEEVKAEKRIFHTNCFRCYECNKQLKPDNYQSHEGVLYCMVHFKLLFSPKCVDDVLEKPCKPELIIRENQPIELPPDVVRASDKPDLGLEELQQLNVRSRFQVFENATKEEPNNATPNSSNVAKRSPSILLKLAKLQALGFSTDTLGLGAFAAEIPSANSINDCKEDDHASNTDNDEGVSLVSLKKNTERERPVGLGDAMDDIKTKFEKGHMMSREERREERKQEIQHIRSRLFMGKQARIKEMYQQAVADSEQAITSTGKKPEIEIGGAARSLRDRFENGELFNDTPDNNIRPSGSSIQENEADVFESAITKKSRSIFMLLDANVAAEKNQPNVHSTKASKMNVSQRNCASVLSTSNNESEPENLEVVKCDEKPDDVEIKTSEISSKFKFFETYRPSEGKKREFRITPPREGVVKMPTPDSDLTEINGNKNLNDKSVIEKSHTTSMMLNKFREMEQNKFNRNIVDAGPRPLKCFTPPPDDGRRLYTDIDSDICSQDEDDDEVDDEDVEEEGDDYDDAVYHPSILHTNDEALKEAQSAARAKLLRAKFEKWETNEVHRALNEGCIDIYSDHVSDDTNIESTKSIRARFENMKDSDTKLPSQPRCQVNRFV